MPPRTPKAVSKEKRAIAYELHVPVRRRYPTRDVVLRRGYRDLFQADLVDMQPYSRENKGYKYLLTHIDVFSKFATAVPLKSKRGDEVAKAYESIIKSKKVAEFLKPGKGSLLHV